MSNIFKYMTIKEMQDYIADIDIEGITLTDKGRGAAKLILEGREHFTPSHKLMLERIRSGVQKLPHKLGRLVVRTRLGIAIEMAREITKVSRKNQKKRARRKAAKARAKAIAE